MKKIYRDKRWQKYRIEKFELDANKCNRCGRSGDEVVLQVHHPKYIKGRKPWEYSYSETETICRGCHAEEHGHKPPSTGWILDHVDDLRDLEGICDLCGTHYRYEFIVSHEKWGYMNVGTICCDHLTKTSTASELIDAEKKYNDKLERFIHSTRWRCIKESGKISCWAIDKVNFKIRIYYHSSGWKVWVSGIAGKKIFSQLDVAKKAAFDFIMRDDAINLVRKNNERGIKTRTQKQRLGIHVSGVRHLQNGHPKTLP